MWVPRANCQKKGKELRTRDSTWRDFVNARTNKTAVMVLSIVAAALKWTLTVSKIHLRTNDNFTNTHQRQISTCKVIFVMAAMVMTLTIFTVASALNWEIGSGKVDVSRKAARQKKRKVTDLTNRDP